MQEIQCLHIYVYVKDDNNSLDFKTFILGIGKRLSSLGVFGGNFAMVPESKCNL